MTSPHDPTVTEHTIFLTVAGSQAHGTARPGSDLDLRGVCVAPLDVRLSLFRNFEQFEGPVPELLRHAFRGRLTARCGDAEAVMEKIECVIFDVAKLVSLCVAANPNALEILFADERDWLLETPVWRRLHARRHRFLTRRVEQTFLGYAMAQLRRIETHRSWLLRPPARKPAREDFGLPASEPMLGREDRNRLEHAIAENRGLHLPPDVLRALNAEKQYDAAMRRWDSYQMWQRHRNPARAELERRFGYDTKHAMHLVRLMRMGAEALETGELRVRRDDAEELAAIRDGALSYEALLKESDGLRARMQASAARSTLPAEVDREEVDALLLEIVLG